jgi:hypothetical protein
MAQHQSLPELFVLSAWGPVAEAAEKRDRFVKCFWQTWESIPHDHREAISDAVQATRSGCVTVEFHDENHTLAEGPSGDASAQCSRDPAGFILVYSSVTVVHHIVSDRTCSYEIAHELAHLYLMAVDPNHGQEYEKAEREVDEVLFTTWGFTQEDHAKWIVQMALASRLPSNPA